MLVLVALAGAARRFERVRTPEGAASPGRTTVGVVLSLVGLGALMIVGAYPREGTLAVPPVALIAIGAGLALLQVRGPSRGDAVPG